MDIGIGDLVLGIVNGLIQILGLEVADENHRKIIEEIVDLLNGKLISEVVE